MFESRKPKWLYKGCPRCGGDLYVQRESREMAAELTAHCLQCGFERMVPLTRSLPTTNREAMPGTAA